MLKQSIVTAHYEPGGLLARIREGVERLGKTAGTVTLHDLAAVDEFHTGGREATEHLLDQLELSPGDHVLEAGCGVGGTSRLLADRYGCRVQGVDLTPEFVAVGTELNKWVGLEDQVSLSRGNVCALGYDDASFSRGSMLHVGMNLDDKAALAREVFRVLKPGGRFGLFDLMRTGSGDLKFPVPWAASAEGSCVEAPEVYRAAFEAAGFDQIAETNRHAFALEFFAALRQRPPEPSGPPPLGLHLLMGEEAPLRLANAVESLEAGRIAPVEMIFAKPS